MLDQLKSVRRFCNLNAIGQPPSFPEQENPPKSATAAECLPGEADPRGAVVGHPQLLLQLSAE